MTWPGAAATSSHAVPHQHHDENASDLPGACTDLYDYHGNMPSQTLTITITNRLMAGKTQFQNVSRGALQTRLHVGLTWLLGTLQTAAHIGSR